VVAGDELQPAPHQVEDNEQHGHGRQHEEEGQQGERHGVRFCPSPRRAGDRCLCDDGPRTRSGIPVDSLRRGDAGPDRAKRMARRPSHSPAGGAPSNSTLAPSLGRRTVYFEPTFSAFSSRSTSTFRQRREACPSVPARALQMV
jgi:hypothetical protein